VFYYYATLFLESLTFRNPLWLACKNLKRNYQAIVNLYKNMKLAKTRIIELEGQLQFTNQLIQFPLPNQKHAFNITR
jgi:hypothetical protein